MYGSRGWRTRDDKDVYSSIKPGLASRHVYLLVVLTLKMHLLVALIQQKSLFCLPTKGTFLNDVCPIGQMMLPTVMMCASHMMCLRTWVANIASLRNEMKQHHFVASLRNIISRHSRRPVQNKDGCFMIKKGAVVLHCSFS